MSDPLPIYFRCRNWHKFQHYPDGSRQISWIKNYIDLDDPGKPFSKLTFAEQGRLQAIWRLAAKLNNVIPFDEKFVARAIGAKRDPFGTLMGDKWFQLGTQTDLKRFANAEKRAAKRRVPASKPLANRYQVASLDLDLDKEPPSPPSGKPKIKCPDCGVEYLTAMRMAEHRRNVHGIEVPSVMFAA